VRQPAAHSIPRPTVAFCWKCNSRREMAAAPSRRSFVVGWKAFRCFDDELEIIPSHSADAPALGVLELDQRRRDAHRRHPDDDMEAPSVADDCSDLEHGHKHAPNACASKESAASAAGSIPSSEACPRVGACRSSARSRETAPNRAPPHRKLGELSRGPGAGSTKPGRAVLDADSYTAGRVSDSKRRASTLSMRPYSIASSAVMK